MQFLDSAANFVLSYFEFVGFYLFVVFAILMLKIAKLICDYLELIFEGEVECMEFCSVLVLYHGLPVDCKMAFLWDNSGTTTLQTFADFLSRTQEK